MACYDTEVLADGPVLYWKLGAILSRIAADSSGNGNDGRTNTTTADDRYTKEVIDCMEAGCPTLSGVEIGEFHGVLSAEWVNQLVGTNPLAGLSTWTIEGWFWHDPAVGSIGSVWGVGDQKIQVRPDGTGKIAFAVLGPTYTRITSKTTKQGCWNHFAVVSSVADGTTRLYINGEEIVDPLVLPVTSATLITGTGVTVGAGTTGGSQNTHGYVAHFALYPTALSAARIALRAARGCGMCDAKKQWTVGSFRFGGGPVSEARISQVMMEVASTSGPLALARVSQVVIEVASTTEEKSNARVSQVLIEVASNS